jgi:putative SOS response-associated peptidase YedK
MSLTIRLNPETQQRTLDALKWGLSPNWAKDPKIAYKTINARAETIDTAPSYREAFKKRRCLIPSDGFYEWKKVPRGKIPYSIGMKDDSPFVFAGLWEGWKDHANGEWLHTCTIIRGEPNEFVREIHTRMPDRAIRDLRTSNAALIQPRLLRLAASLSAEKLIDKRALFPLAPNDPL